MRGCPVQYDPDGHNIGPEDVAVFEVFSRGSEELPESKALATDVKTLIPFTTLEPLNPIVSPPIVTVNADAPIVAPDVVITTDVAEVALQVAVSPATLLAPPATKGVMDDAKNPEGYVSVMVPPFGIGTAAVKLKVTGTQDKRTTRSDEAIENVTEVTCKEMSPDATAVDATVSDDVCTTTPTAPGVAAPIVSPLIVKVNADAPIVAPDVVITTEVAEVAPQVAVSPATLLAPGATVGVTEDAKKPEGYVSVMVPPEEIGKNGENPRMTGTEDCPAMRSDEAMTKNTSVT